MILRISSTCSLVHRRSVSIISFGTSSGCILPSNKSFGVVFKSSHNLINDEILAMDASELGIPLGNLVIPELFSGKGPVIPVSIISIRNSDASFFSTFTEAGINQTLQRIIMDVCVDVSVLVLGRTDSFAVSSQVVVAETVIVGQVPDTFFHTGGEYGN